MINKLKICARGVYRIVKEGFLFARGVAVLMVGLTAVVGPLFAAIETSNAHWLWIYLIHFTFFSYYAGKD